MTTDEKPPPTGGAVTFTFTLQVRIDGHAGPLTLEADSMNALVKKIKLLGEAPGIEIIDPPPVWATTAEGTSLCPKHGVPMRKRERQGDIWWSHNAGEEGSELWCRGYRGKDSPGYDR